MAMPAPHSGRAFRTRLLVLLLSLSAYCGHGATDPGGEVTYQFSFEADLEGWTAEGIDLVDPPVAWEIGRSQDRSTDGAWSIKYYLENYNDAGKIWLRKTFAVEVGRSYRVDLSFSFSSCDFGMANLWNMIAGALDHAPATAADLPIRGSTGNGSDEDVGWVWMNKTYTDEVIAGGDGLLHVVVGVWGTWETPRTYYVDRIRVVLTALP